MPTLYPNKLDSIEGSITTDGFTGSISCLVSDLNMSLGAHERIVEAINAVGLKRGDPHPVWTDSSIQTINFTAISQDQVLLTYNYLPMINLPLKISGGSSVAETETNKLIDGSILTVSYTYPANYHDPSKAGMVDVVGKNVNKKMATCTLSLTENRVIDGSAAMTLAQQYGGKLNTTGWNLRPVDLARYWLCEGVGYEFAGVHKIDGVVKNIYTMTYNFSYYPGTWDTEVVYTDPETGNPPDPDTWMPGETSKVAKVTAEIDFTGLTGHLTA